MFHCRLKTATYWTCHCCAVCITAYCSLPFGDSHGSAAGWFTWNTSRCNLEQQTDCQSFCLHHGKSVSETYDSVWHRRFTAEEINEVNLNICESLETLVWPPPSNKRYVNFCTTFLHSVKHVNTSWKTINQSKHACMHIQTWSCEQKNKWASLSLTWDYFGQS